MQKQKTKFKSVFQSVANKRKLKFISVSQSEAKTKKKSKIQIGFSMSCENEKCKWHLNSIFPYHRKTVGTKVHALRSIQSLEQFFHSVINYH